MAVKRVFGKVDGKEVMYSHAGGNRWNLPVPLDEDGEYVVEVVAEDDAGNQSYIAKMLFVVNRALLCVHIVQEPYLAVLQEAVYYTELIEPVCDLVGRRC